MGCRTITDIWVNGATKWANEQFACSVESGMDGNSEVRWECLLVCEHKGCALGSASCGLWVVSLHEFGEFLGEVGCWEVFCVLGVEPFVPCWG
jgi:hypothetical protein